MGEREGAASQVAAAAQAVAVAVAGVLRPCTTPRPTSRIRRRSRCPLDASNYASTSCSVR